MSVASEITRIKGNIANAYIEAGKKGATLPATQNSENLAGVISSIVSGGATPFADATIEEIQQIANEISANNMTSAEVASTYGWKIGDTKSITLTTEEIIEIRIIGFNHDDLSDGSGKAGITLEMSGTLKSIYALNANAGYSNANAGGWAALPFRTDNLPTIKATLPTEWQNIIKLVDKKSANGGSTNFTEVVTTSDSLFLLSESEVFATATQAQNAEEEGNQYEFYAINTAAKRIKGSVGSWWLRSCSASSANNFLSIDYSAAIYPQRPTNTDKVSFAFCIGSASDIPVAGLPIEATTDTEMTNALVEDNLGKVYRFTGTSDIYETDAIYIVSEVE